jgi:hypothetical protein
LPGRSRAVPPGELGGSFHSTPAFREGSPRRTAGMSGEMFGERCHLPAASWVLWRPVVRLLPVSGVGRRSSFALGASASIPGSMRSAGEVQGRPSGRSVGYCVSPRTS